MIDSKTSKMFRGIAILMVIASHFAAGMYAEPVFPVAKGFISKWGIYGVDIFFLLSGYGLVKSADKNGITKTFVLKRLMNSYVPYILIIGFFAIIEKSVDGPKALWTLVSGADFWFMNIIFVFYIIFMIVYKIDKFKEIFITIAIVGYSYWMYNSGKSDFWVLSNGAFLVGIYAASLEERFGEKVKLWINRVNLIAIAFVVMMISWAAYASNEKMWVHMVLSMSFSVMALGIIANCSGGGIILPAIGRYSLYIYLLHLRLFWKYVMIFVERYPQWSYRRIAMISAAIMIIISVAVGYAMEWNLGWLCKLPEIIRNRNGKENVKD